MDSDKNDNTGKNILLIWCYEDAVVQFDSKWQHCHNVFSQNIQFSLVWDQWEHDTASTPPLFSSLLCTVAFGITSQKSTVNILAKNITVWTQTGLSRLPNIEMIPHEQYGDTLHFSSVVFRPYCSWRIFSYFSSHAKSQIWGDWTCVKRAQILSVLSAVALFLQSALFWEPCRQVAPIEMKIQT